MHGNIESVSLARFEISGFGHRLALRSAYAGAGDLRDCAVGRDI